MILITTALYCEARPFIQYCRLKKDTSFTRFQVFRNEEILLLITGTGAMQAAIGTAATGSLISPSKQDIFLNVGVCGSGQKGVSTGTVFLGNKIVDAVTGRCFYPDLLYSHPFKEGTILTCPAVVNKVPDGTSEVKSTFTEVSNPPGNCLIDMEAAGFYQAASCFYKPHRMFFIKIISDHLDTSDITPEAVTQIIRSPLPEIMGWIGGIQKELLNSPVLFTPEEEEYISEIAPALQLSVSMEQQLRQVLKYVKLKDGGFTGRLSEFLQDKPLPCKTKTEGKKYLEQIKKMLL